MTITITPRTSIVFEQVKSYDKCRNIIRTLLEHSSEPNRSIQCEMENDSESPIKIKVWLKIKKIYSGDKHGSIKEDSRKSDARTVVLLPHTKTIEEYKIETPRSPGLYSATFVCHDKQTARRTKKVIPTIKCIKDGTKLRFVHAEHFQVYSHRSGIQHNNKYSLFLVKGNKTPNKTRKRKHMMYDDDEDYDEDYDEEDKKSKEDESSPLSSSPEKPTFLPLAESKPVKRTKFFDHNTACSFEELNPNSEFFSAKTYVNLFFEDGEEDCGNYT